MPELTYKQKLRQSDRQALNYARQARMPPDTRPRISPRDNIPGPTNGVTPTDFVSCRVCIEHPEDHPNDFLYLFRRVGRLRQPEFFWLDMLGANRGTRKTYPSIFAAIAPYVRDGWEDASW